MTQESRGGKSTSRSNYLAHNNGALLSAGILCVLGILAPATARTLVFQCLPA